MEVRSLLDFPPEPVELVCEPCADYVPDFRGVCTYIPDSQCVFVCQQRCLTASVSGRIVSFRQELEVYWDEWRFASRS